jgi:hypothetical protein
MSRIFISYRRGDSGDYAQKLYKRLSSHFGQDKVAFDLQFQPGVNYLDTIGELVGACDVLIAVIGRQWLRATDRAGRPRLKKDDDLVRLEIKTALDREILVIPVLVDGAIMPERKDLPKVLDRLALQHAVEATEAGMNKLIPVLETALMQRNPRTAAYLFSGTAIGVNARFADLDGAENLIPALAASVVPTAGGLSKGYCSNYNYDVDRPSRRTLLSLKSGVSTAAGRKFEGRGETEVDVEVESTTILEKLYLPRMRLHFLFRVNPKHRAPAVTTSGNEIERFRAGNVNVAVQLDDELLTHCGSTGQLADFYRKSSSEYRRQNCWRFGVSPEESQLALRGVFLRCTLVQGIQLCGPETQMQEMAIDGNQVIWAGFGRIILGEVLVDSSGPYINMVRVEMDSDVQGVATICEAHAYGQMRP